MQKIIAAVLSLLFLGAYVLIFAWVCIFHRETSETMQLLGMEITSEPVAYIWTSVSVLVGGVVAVAYGLPEPPTANPLPPELIVNIYAIAYFAVGFVAAVVWVVVGATTNLLIINAASTFIGLAVPIISAFLRKAQRRNTHGVNVA